MLMKISRCGCKRTTNGRRINHTWFSSSIGLDTCGGWWS